MKPDTRPTPAQIRTALCATVLPQWARLLETAQAHSNTAVVGMMSAFSGLTPFLEAAEQGLLAGKPCAAGDATVLSGLVERMYMGLQYQDRISQMVALVQTDMQHMLQAMTAADAVIPMDSADWLKRLESQYAMAEQHQDHPAVNGSTPAAAHDDQTTFF